jgi:DNA-binding transcriptional LysR family regulator
LERELKNQLLVRSARPLTLTSAGKMAYQTAKGLSLQTENLKLQLSELSHQKLNLKIGMIDSVADALFSDSKGLDSLGDAKVSMVINNSRYLAEAVERGDLDIAFIAEGSGKLPAVIQKQSIGSEPLVVVAGASYKTQRHTINNFIAYDQPSTTFGLVKDVLSAQDISLQTTLYSTSPTIMLRMALLQKGAAALPYLMVKPYISSGELKMLGDKKPWLIPRPIITVTRRDQLQPPALGKLSEQLLKILAGLTAEASQNN